MLLGLRNFPLARDAGVRRTQGLSVDVALAGETVSPSHAGTSMDIYYGTPVTEWCNYKTFITEQYCTEKVVVSKEGGRGGTSSQRLGMHKIKTKKKTKIDARWMKINRLQPSPPSLRWVSLKRSPA